MGELPGKGIVPASAPEAAPPGMFEFTPRARAALDRLEFPVLTLSGSSIREIGANRPVSILVRDEEPIYKIKNTPTQVSFSPRRTMVYPWRRSYLDDPEGFNRERRQRFATMLPHTGDAQDMLFALGNPADYAELASLGDPVIEQLLFGEYGNANVMTRHITVGERIIKGESSGSLSWMGPVKDETLPPLVASVGFNGGKILIADFRADFEGTDTSSPDRNVTSLRIVPLIFPAGYQSGEASAAA